MSVTWDELDSLKLTWSEVDKLSLSWGKFDDMDYPDLLKLAKDKLERFQELPPEKQGLFATVIPLIKTILAQASAALLVDAAKSTDWKQLLIEAIKLLDQITTN